MSKFKIQQSDTLNHPLGVVLTDRGFHVSVVSESKTCAMLLYQRNEKDIYIKLEFPLESKIGNVWAMYVETTESLENLEYNFINDREIFPDPYAKSFSGRDTWGKLEHFQNIRRSPFIILNFHWEGDKPLKYPFEDSIFYRLHVRGFTKSSSSKVIQKGTFDGILEKVDYLKDLGITSIILMPCQEFEEIMVGQNIYSYSYYQEGYTGTQDISKLPSGKLNYWGYVPAFHFSPKTSYARKKNRDVVTEFKHLVRELHKQGIEVLVEMYFSPDYTVDYILAAMRYWVKEYHIDGIQVTGFAPYHIIANDPYLVDTKLIFESYLEENFGKDKYIGFIDSGFLVDMRKFLKGDEGMISRVMHHIKSNPYHIAKLNYLADIKGMSMMDMVSYDMKHNEANGENNQDGTDYNHSWNCGVEGVTKKRKVLELRYKQLRNGLIMLFLSQGTPILFAGDEFGQTRQGNNNTYCQDNEISWQNWKLVRSNAQLLDFVKKLIAFRKAHPIFHMKTEPRMMDTLACGKPDMSYHGINVWQPSQEHWRRQLGVLYYGKYAKKVENQYDDTFYVIYNMHWESHEFAIPSADKGYLWHLCMDSTKAMGIYTNGNEPLLEEQRKIFVEARSIVVLIAKR